MRKAPALPPLALDLLCLLLAVVVLEFCEKGSLKGYVEDNDVPTEQQLLFALDAARGLEYCHTKKFVHR